MPPPSVLESRKHCSSSHRIDAYGGRPTRLPIFGTFLTEIHTFNSTLLHQKIKPGIKNVLLHKRSVVDQS